MNILGISCFYHDSAAALIKDGEIIAATQEERFTCKKYEPSFPANAINYCLQESGLKTEDLDLVAFYEKPFAKFLWIKTLIRKRLDYNGKILFMRHQESHAASAFYPSPFDEAAILTIDDPRAGETASFGAGKGNGLEIKPYLKSPHSLGLFYSAFTRYVGFKTNSDEYKLMGLAPYGKPKYKDLILKELVSLKEDGSFNLNMKYFSRGFEKFFGGPPRKPDAEITQKEMDIAASAQKVTEEIMLKMASHVHKTTGKDKLCLAGGVALNCVANWRVLKEGPFKKIWIQPASGEAGGALGAALLVWYKYLGNKRVVDENNDAQKSSLLGPHYSDSYIEDFLKKENIPYRKLSDAELPKMTADLVAKGNVVGWFQGRMEFGPRALGSRSIIADARDAGMQSKLNSDVKCREPFRPFAPSVLREKASEWFDLDRESPYMLFVAQVKRSGIPAVTHVDNSARVQTVKRQDNPLYYDMINEFYKLTGCPVIINTSFNTKDEPIVRSPEEAFSCFARTKMDYLVMGHFLIDKK